MYVGICSNLILCMYYTYVICIIMRVDHHDIMHIMLYMDNVILNIISLYFKCNIIIILNQ